jgi:phospholipase C
MAKLLFDHIVVLMLENRSFDHLFGYLGIGEGLDPKKPATNHLVAGNAKSQAFSSQRGGDYTAAGQGPSHSLKQVNEQLFGVTKPSPAVQKKTPGMDGFVSSFEVSLQYDLKRKPTTTELQQVMNVFDPEQLPVLSTLAKSFVLCDHWFADVPGPTMPNRAFVHAATSQGYTYNANWKPKFTCKTIYDRINATPGVTWRVYKHDQDDVLELYPNVKSGTTNHVAFTEYVSDVAGDTLATYSFIVPAFLGKTQEVNSMHAPADVRPGEKLVADVYSALREHPDVWKKTLLIILFDEHGGYYDHVPPPQTVAPDAIKGRMDQPFLVPFDFTRLGLRVPAILISPWFPAAVDSTVYSHSTIPGSLIDAFGLKGGYLTKRDAKAAKLTQKYLVDDGKRTWRTDAPDVVVPAQPPALDAMQRELLHGAALADPDPAKQNPARVDDIQDPTQAKQFVQTQFAKRLEHKIAARGKGEAATASAYNEPPGTAVSPSRIAELRRPAAAPGPRP